ncbi:MAG: D-TA family PLP-dependent enzyme [Chloroflexi bacterium]|nr:MAG: D-TA family PLP-dependent enzyme [Chloroflexota bacterium]
MHINELDTPSVLIDLDRMEANIARMQKRCDDLGLAFRPHIKTHKIPDIAKMQVEVGAKGIACQKVSEARVFAEAGFDDIQIPNSIVGQQKTARLMELAMYTKITVAADHPNTIAWLDDAAQESGAGVRVLVDIATALQRTGTQVAEVVTLAQRIEAAEGLHFAGIMAYPSDLTERENVQEALAALDSAGIGVDVVSGGGTGAALVAHEFPELTELRVGTYIFNDWPTVEKGWATWDDVAMTVMATVISRPTTDRTILDSGSKTLSSDVWKGQYGYIVEYPGARIYQLNEEHAFVDMSECEERPVLGERVTIVPVHTCVVTNLHNQLFGVRNDEVEVTWPVAARGMVW